MFWKATDCASALELSEVRIGRLKRPVVPKSMRVWCRGAGADGAECSAADALVRSTLARFTLPPRSALIARASSVAQDEGCDRTKLAEWIEALIARRRLGPEPQLEDLECCEEAYAAQLRSLRSATAVVDADARTLWVDARLPSASTVWNGILGRFAEKSQRCLPLPRHRRSRTTSSPEPPPGKAASSSFCSTYPEIYIQTQARETLKRVVDWLRSEWGAMPAILAPGEGRHSASGEEEDEFSDEWERGSGSEEENATDDARGPAESFGNCF